MAAAQYGVILNTGVVAQHQHQLYQFMFTPVFHFLSENPSGQRVQSVRDLTSIKPLSALALCLGERFTRSQLFALGIALILSELENTNTNRYWLHRLGASLKAAEKWYRDDGKFTLCADILAALRSEIEIFHRHIRLHNKTACA